MYIFSLWQRSFPSPLYVTSRLEQATREFLENFPKVRTPFPTFKALFKLLPHSKRLKAHLIIKRSAFKTFKTLGSIYSILNARGLGIRIFNLYRTYLLSRFTSGLRSFIWQCLFLATRYLGNALSQGRLRSATPHLGDALNLCLCFFDL